MHDHHRFRRLICGLLALVAVLSACGSIPASSTATHTSAQTAAIQTAVQQHLAHQSVPPAARIDLEMQTEQYARVRIIPADSEDHPTIGYLRRQDQTWAMLGIGVAFDPDFYARYGIPQSLRLP